MSRWYDYAMFVLGACVLAALLYKAAFFPERFF